MRILVVDKEGIAKLGAPLDGVSAELIELQLSLCTEPSQANAFVDRLLRAIGNAIAESVQYDLKPPSAAQIEYATVIARDLCIALAPEVLRYRGHMHTFLDQHVPAHRARRENRSPRRSSKRLTMRAGQTDDDIPF